MPMKRKHMVYKLVNWGGVTIQFLRAKFCKQNRFIDPRRLIKAFFFMRNDKKVRPGRLDPALKAYRNTLTDRIKAYNYVCSGRLVSILHNISYRQSV